VHDVVHQASTLIYPLAAVAYRMPGLESPDFLPSYVLQAILDSDRGPLHALANSGEALDAEFISEPYVPEAQLAYATAALGPRGDPTAMASRLESLVADYVRRGIPQELFETTRRRLIADQEQSRNSIESLASDWATTIADDDEPSIAREQELIGAVTLAQVDRVARRYLDTRQTVVGSLFPSAGASQAVPAAPPQQGPEKQLEAEAPVAQLPGWASDLVEHVTVPDSPLAPVQTKLPSGITLIVQPETISDSIFVYGSIRADPDLEEPPGKEGVARILGELFQEGTKSKDRGAVLRAEDDLGAQFVAGADFALQSPTASFDNAVALLARNELEPRFDSASFERAHRRAAEELATELNGSHTVAMQRAAAKLLPPGDPQLRQASVDGVEALTLGDVESYYAKTFRPDLATIVIVGNVTPQAARAVVERAFARWHAVGDPPSLELPNVPLNAPADVTETLPSSGQDYVTLEQIVTATRASAAYYPLEVGNAILGGAAGSPEQSRLFRDLRQNAGLVYSVSSDFSAQRTRSQFTISFACLPENEHLIASSIDAEIAKLQTEPAPDFELSLVKASLVRRTVIAAGSVSGIGGSLLEDAQNGYPLDQAQIDARAFVATDAGSVRDAFANYIHPDHFVRIVEGP
jgi:zinc protease